MITGYGKRGTKIKFQEKVFYDKKDCTTAESISEETISLLEHM